MSLLDNPSEDLVEGDHQLCAAFRAGQAGNCQAGAALLAFGSKPTQVYQLRTGLAYRRHNVAEGRRTIVDLYVPGDIVGIEAVIDRGAAGTVVAASSLRFWSLEAAAIRGMMEGSRAVALRVVGIVLEAHQRAASLAARIARLDASERVAFMLIDLHERMLQTGLIHRNTFNLQLTQQQIANHLGLSGVHINRVLRWLAREQMAFVEHQVVIINDLTRLRMLAHGTMPTGMQMAHRRPLKTLDGGSPLRVE